MDEWVNGKNSVKSKRVKTLIKFIENGMSGLSAFGRQSANFQFNFTNRNYENIICFNAHTI